MNIARRPPSASSSPLPESRQRSFLFALLLVSAGNAGAGLKDDVGWTALNARLGTDRPHQFKAFGFYQWPWGTTTGLNFYAASGTPITREASVQTVPVQYLGRGSDGRTPVFNQTDLYLAHDIRLPGDNRVQVSMNVLNLFDQKIAREYFNTETLQDVSVDLADYFAGRVDIQNAIATQDIQRDPRFLMANVFQAPRSIRFAVKYIF